MFHYKRWELALTIALLFLITYASVAGAQQAKLSKEVLRLHVVAASDESEAQRVKLCVRDTVLAELSPKLSTAKTQGEVRRIVRSELQEIANTAQQTVWREGGTDGVTVRLCSSPYPTREYAGGALPAGRYFGLRIVIGAGQGHNWWCVIFPPLCTEAATDSAAVLTEEEQALVQRNGARYAVRFKTAEWVGELREKLGV